MLDVKRDESVKKKKEISIIRSSAAEYLTFITATGESDVNAIYFEENVWLNQKTMGFQFRKWANGVIKEFTIKGFVMDDERLKNFGTVLTKD